MKPITVVAALAVACTDAPDETAIDAYLRSLPLLAAAPSAVDERATSAPFRTGDYSCTRTDLSETRQLDHVVAYAAGSESMWPGAIVAGESVSSGLFTQMVFDRAPLTFSVDLENLAGAKSATLEAPSLSAYREALGGLLEAEITGATPARIFSDIEEVHSQDQASIALGADVAWGLGVGRIAGSFDWSRETTRSRFVVHFTQAYYTVDVDAFRHPADVFAPSVTLGEIESRLTPANPPLYVSSITYGRSVVFTLESDFSSQELRAALEATFSGGAADVSAAVAVSHAEMLSRSKITAFILGGSGAEAARSIDSYEALLDFIKQGGDYSRQSPGAPIAYKLAHLADNSPAKMSFTIDYEIERCERVNQKVQVIARSITVEHAGGDPGGELELFGTLWAESKGVRTNVFSRDGANWVQIREGNTWPTTGSIGEAIIDVDPRAGSTITVGANLFDSDVFGSQTHGNEVVVAAFETGWRKEISVLLSGANARVRIAFELRPI